MLDPLFRRPCHARRLRANPLGFLFDDFAAHLLRRGHGTGFVRQLLRAAEHYGFWLGTRFDPVTADRVTADSARQFVREHLPSCSCARPFPRSLVSHRVAANHLLRLPAVRDAVRSQPAGPHDQLLADYGHFLLDTCGLSAHTRLYRLRDARAFLARVFGDGTVEVGRLRPADLQDYFRRHAGRLSPASVNVLAGSLRGFLRFLALSHGLDPRLTQAVPSAARRPRDRLPKSLPEQDLQAVLGWCDPGGRDLAMLRCMSDLGLRVGEVAALTLDDIDWRHGTLTIRGGKGRRDRRFPLPAPLGEAVAAYLRSGRPSSPDRHLFLRHTVPVGTPVTHDLIRAVFRHAYAEATGRTGSVGTHVLRHTAAARMRAAGHSLQGIADVLGRRSIDTTAIYVKLDVEALRSVALPWPGGAS